MKKMAKGCAIVTIVASMTMFIGCSKASKYESLCEEITDLAIDTMELYMEKQIEFKVKEFKGLSKDEQDAKLKELEEEGKEAKKKFKELKKKIKEVKREEDMLKLPWGL